MQDAGFRRVQTGPTFTYRVDNEMKTSDLDYFFTNEQVNELQPQPKTSVISCGFSDHDAALVEIPIGTSKIIKHSTKKYTIQTSKIRNEKRYKEDVKRTISQYMKLSPFLQCNDKAQKLSEALSSIINKHTRIQRVEIGKPKRPVISQGTKDLMFERDAAKRIMKKMTPTERHIQHSKYKTLRNRVVASIRSDQKKAAEKKLSRGTNPWHVANDFLGKNHSMDLPIMEDGLAVTDDQKKAEIMNEYFINKVDLLRKQIALQQVENPLHKLQQKYMKR